jgi:hypothetical protein
LSPVPPNATATQTAAVEQLRATADQGAKLIVFPVEWAP